MSDKCNGNSTGAIKKTVTAKPKKQKKQKLTKEEQEATNEMLTLISTLQSERIDSQRAELRPVSKTKRKPFPGLLSHGSIKEPKSDDFLDMIEKIQGTRLEDQRTELPAKKPKEKKKTLPDDDFFAQIMRAQAGRMEDQRASIPLKEKKDQNKPTNSKK